MGKHPSSIKVGLSWIVGSFQLFSKNPAKWLLLAFSYVMIFGVLPSLAHIPLLITLIIVLFWPGFLALVIGVYREADQGRDTELADLLRQIKPQVGGLVALGGICLIYCLLVGMFVSGDAETLNALINQKAAPEQILTLALPLMIKLLLFCTPLLMATWFSPMLVAYQGFSVVEAIKHSLWASWNNLATLGAALLVLTLGLVLVMFLMGVIAGLVAAISPDLSTILMSLLLFFSMLVMTSFMFSIQYFSYRHVYYQAPDVAE